METIQNNTISKINREYIPCKTSCQIYANTVDSSVTQNSWYVCLEHTINSSFLSVVGDM